VHCGDLVIKAHKFVLMAHSETLRVALSSDNFVEGQSGVYTVSEENMSPDILQDAIRSGDLRTNTVSAEIMSPDNLQDPSRSGDLRTYGTPLARKL
jgi:BTB/POZ domain